MMLFPATKKCPAKLEPGIKTLGKTGFWVLGYSPFVPHNNPWHIIYLEKKHITFSIRKATGKFEGSMLMISHYLAKL